MLQRVRRIARNLRLCRGLRVGDNRNRDTHARGDEYLDTHRNSVSHSSTSWPSGDESRVGVTTISREKSNVFCVGGIAKGGKGCLPFARTGNECRPAERAPSGDDLI